MRRQMEVLGEMLEDGTAQQGRERFHFDLVEGSCADPAQGCHLSLGVAAGLPEQADILAENDAFTGCHFTHSFRFVVNTIT